MSFLEFEPTPQALSSVLGRDTVMVIRGVAGSPTGSLSGSQPLQSPSHIQPY
jgi:hypothetical protein